MHQNKSWPVPHWMVMVSKNTGKGITFTTQLSTMPRVFILCQSSPLCHVRDRSMLYTIGDRRNSVYAWTLKVWERKGRVGRAIHSGEKGPPCHDGGSFLTTVFCPFPPSLFSLRHLEFKHKLNVLGPPLTTKKTNFVVLGYFWTPLKTLQKITKF